MTDNGATNDAPAQPTNVIEALRAVMRDLPGIGRASKADQAMGGYQYRGIEDITQHTQALFAKHGVVFVPRILQETWQRDEVTVGGKPWHDERMQVEYDIYGPGGIEDMITVGPIPAIGRDGADKGANKAMTQAYKYALLQTLNIADKADDADQGSPLRDGQHGTAPATADQSAALRELIKQASDAQLAAELFATDDAGVKIVMGVPVWEPFTDGGGTPRLRLLPDRQSMAVLIEHLRDQVQAVTDPTGLMGPEEEPDPDAPDPASTGPSKAPEEPAAESPPQEPAGEAPVNEEAVAPPEGDAGDALAARRAKFEVAVKAMTLTKVRQTLANAKQDDHGSGDKVRERLVDHYMAVAIQADLVKAAG